MLSFSFNKELLGNQYFSGLLVRWFDTQAVENISTKPQGLYVFSIKRWCIGVTAVMFYIKTLFQGLRKAKPCQDEDENRCPLDFS